MIVPANPGYWALITDVDVHEGVATTKTVRYPVVAWVVPEFAEGERGWAEPVLPFEDFDGVDPAFQAIQLPDGVVLSSRLGYYSDMFAWEKTCNNIALATALNAEKRTAAVAKE